MLILNKTEAEELGVQSYLNWNTLSKNDLTRLDEESVRVYENYVNNKYKSWNKEYGITKSREFWALAHSSWLLCLIQHLVKIEEELTTANQIIEFPSYLLCFEKPYSSSEILRDVQDPIFLSKLRGLTCIYAKTGEVSIEVSKKFVRSHKPLREYIRSLFGIRADRIGGLSLYDQVRLEFTVRCWRRYYDSFPNAKRFSSVVNFEGIDSELIDSLLSLCPAIVEKEIRLTPSFKQNIILLGSQGLRNNDYYRLYVAHAVERGAKIVGYQHGGDDYGLALNASEIEYLEFQNSLFLSWGYTNIFNKKLDIVPVPSALLSGIPKRNQSKLIYTDIIVVGTRMPLNNKFLNARPDLKGWLRYRKFKKQLLLKLRDAEKDYGFRLLYRPYRSCENALEDKEFIKNSIEGIRFLEGDLHQALQKCKLVIIDHHGTTVNIAMHANIPTILLWDPSSFPLNNFAQSIFKVLEENGIYHKSIESCIDFLRGINFEVNAWWYNTKTQKARKRFVEVFARSTEEDLVKSWNDSIINCINQ